MSLRRFDNAVSALAPDATVTTVEPIPTDPGRCRLRVGGRLLGDFDQDALESLGLRVGSDWTPDRADAARRLLERTMARRDALRALGRRAMSRGELRAKLENRGYGRDLAESVVAELEAQDWLDDDAFARDVCRRQLDRRPVPPDVLAARLRNHQVDDAMAETIARETTAGIDFVEAAVTLGRSRLVTMRRVDPRVASRRIAGVLARRGFDEEIVRAALDKLALPTEEAWDGGPDETMPHGSNLES